MTDIEHVKALMAGFHATMQDDSPMKEDFGPVYLGYLATVRNLPDMADRKKIIEFFEERGCKVSPTMAFSYRELSDTIEEWHVTVYVPDDKNLEELFPTAMVNKPWSTMSFESLSD